MPGVLLVLLQLLLAVTARAQNVARPCSYDSDCVQDGYCFMNSYCRCKAGYVISGSHRNNTLACLREATAMGDACGLDIQCSRPFGAHARCLAGNVCGCREGAHFRDDLCYPSARVGAQCTVRNDCRVGASTMDASCVRGTCMCQRGFHGSNQGRDCVPDVLLGDRCSTDSDCSTPNATCSGEVCRCVVNHVGNSRNTRCLRYASRLGEACEEDIQCSEMLENSVCSVSGVCSCPPMYHAVSEDSWCWLTARLGEACTNWRHCARAANTTGAATCDVTGVCSCVPGYSPTEDYTDCTSSAGVTASRQGMIFCLAALCCALLCPRL